MTEQPDVPARDEGDEHPDDMVGKPAHADHDLDPDDFDVEDDGDGEDA